MTHTPLTQKLLLPWIVRKTGRCANGAERDGGHVLHVVMTDGPQHTPGWQAALCGSRPGARLGNGWAEVDGAEVPTCPRCRRAADKLVEASR